MVYWNSVIDFSWFFFVWFFINMIGSLLKIKKKFVWKSKVILLKIIFKRLAYILNALSHITQPQSFKKWQIHTFIYDPLYSGSYPFEWCRYLVFLRVLVQTGVKKNQAVYQDNEIDQYFKEKKIISQKKLLYYDIVSLHLKDIVFWFCLHKS